MTSNNPLLDTPAVLRRLRKGEFDFLDFGCSKGGSIALAQRLFDGKSGLGIDIDEEKVRQTIEAGYEAININILDLPPKELVRFTIMSHFLEHVPDRVAVAKIIRNACILSREFVFIKQPYFDSDGYLFQNGLKLYWSDWHGHRNTMSTMDFYSILAPQRKAGRLGNFSIHLSGPISSSSHPAIHPLISPADQHEYDRSKHPPKPQELEFAFPVFSEIIVMISMPDVKHYEPFKKITTGKTIYESPGCS